MQFILNYNCANYIQVFIKITNKDNIIFRSQFISIINSRKILTRWMKNIYFYYSAQGTVLHRLQNKFHARRAKKVYQNTHSLTNVTGLAHD